MKNFSFYFKKGLVLAKLACKGKSVFTKLLLGLYLIVSFFGKLLFLTRPIFLIADNNLALMVVEGHDFEINKLFEGVNNKKRYSSLLLANLFIEGIFIGAFIILVLPFIIWSVLPQYYNATVNPLIFVYVFSGVVSALYLVLSIIYAPMGYITVKGKDLNSGDILFLSKEGSSNAKGKILGLYFLHYLFIYLILGALIGGAIAIASLMKDPYGVIYFYVNFIILAIFLVLAVLDIFVLSKFKMALIISLYSLFRDNIPAKHIIVATKGSSTGEYVPIFSDDKEEK